VALAADCGQAYSLPLTEVERKRNLAGCLNAAPATYGDRTSTPLTRSVWLVQTGFTLCGKKKFFAIYRRCHFSLRLLCMNVCRASPAFLHFIQVFLIDFALEKHKTVL
jgi:hypothetical protein